MIVLTIISLKETGRPKNRVQAVDIACELLQNLQERERAGITELADALGYAKSSVHTQLATLEANELVVKDGTKYRLSLQFLDMAESVKNQIRKYDVITTEIDALAEKTGELVQFGTEEHGWLVYLYKAKGETAVETKSGIGTREYLHSTSLGKAILSEYSETKVDEIIDKCGLPQKTDRTTTTRDQRMEDLAATRERGYAIDDEENLSGVRCLGAPVLDEEDNVLGALSISGPSRRITDDRIENELEDGSRSRRTSSRSTISIPESRRGLDGVQFRHELVRRAFALSSL